PIHLGGTRWAAVGDALGRVLTAQGADVTREYYFNDHGSQIDRFTESLIAAAAGDPTPENGYAGQYISDIAADVLRRRPDAWELTTAGRTEVFRSIGRELMFGHVKRTLAEFGSRFDVYFHENQLFDSGAVDRSVDELKAAGNLYEADCA